VPSQYLNPHPRKTERPLSAECDQADLSGSRAICHGNITHFRGGNAMEGASFKTAGRDLFAGVLLLPLP
jgi:hypothetical protein